jgi:uncharacterized protein YegJ (DUF2314 family)
MNRREWEINNIEQVHNDECMRRLESFQATFDESQWKLMAVSVAKGGKVTVKTAFNDFRGTEHMWVDVDCVDLRAKAAPGSLGNDPYYVDNIGFGDRVIVRFEDISDLNIVQSIPSEVIINGR